MDQYLPIHTSDFIIIMLSFLGAITIHECAHAFIAYYFGDDTAARAGRLSLNPLVHIDIIGLLCLFIFHIGWAKPVPINVYNFKYPKFYGLLTAFAGPISNLMFALFSLYMLKYLPIGYFSSAIQSYITVFFQTTVQLNIMLGLFNLIPIPPLDGSHIIDLFIPEKYKATYYKMMPLFIILLLVVISLPASQEFLFRALAKTTDFLKILVI
jgi:Zn-dependent protease